MDNELLISRLDKIDWDFTGDTCASSFSVTHWHPCRFVSQIPATLIGLLTSEGDVVLDPYNGSGTTVVEAQRLGRFSIGIDVNPVAILQTKAKVFSGDAVCIEKALNRLLNEVINASANSIDTISDLEIDIPDAVQSDKWYHPITFRQLCFLWDYINNSRSKYKAVLEASFSAILLSVCNETRHWGYVCDNTNPKGVRYVDAIEQFSNVVSKYIHAYKERGVTLGRGAKYPLPEVNLVLDDSRSYMRKMDADSVDLIVTSPPYFGVCDYVKSQRLSMEWFGYEIEPYRKKETGARSKRHRKLAATEYLQDLQELINESHRVIKANKYIALIVGESSSRKSTISDIQKMMEDAGFEMTLSKLRMVPVQRRQHPSIKQEYIFVGKAIK